MGAGIYIHIPYCVKKCAYCDFVSYPVQNQMGAYLDALKAEMELYALDHADEVFDTVFIGGGTPSLLTGDAMQRLMGEVRSYFRLSPDAEITMESNPGTLTAEKLDGYRKAGINRLSIGIQSLDEGLLKTIGRIHTADQALDAVRSAADAGFQNINVDVMHGLPGQTVSMYLDTLRQLISLGTIKHISAYSLILEEGTPLYDSVESGSLTLPDDDETADMQDAGMDLLEKNGFARYEISNFAAPGCECRHNLNYWKNGSYLGFGVAAHSAFSVNGRWTRWSNVTDPLCYIKMLSNGKKPLESISVIGPEEERFETVMLGLRTVQGLDLESFRERFQLDLYSYYRNSVDTLKKQGLCGFSDGRFYLNWRGLDLQNTALLPFMEEHPFSE